MGTDTVKFLTYNEIYGECQRLKDLLNRALPSVEEMASLTESEEVAQLAKEIREVLGME